MDMEIGGEGELPPIAVDAGDGEPSSNLNISDVLIAIQSADPTFQQVESAVVAESAAVVESAVALENAPVENMFGGSMQAGAAPPARDPLQRPYIRIVEQPAAKSIRFRYKCEGRSAGSIPGANSTAENKTFPTIEIVGYQSPSVVVVSCVTKDKPYRPHPHNLVGKDTCNKGVCTVKIDADTMRYSFTNLGIQCVKKRDIEEALRVREQLRVDPFKTGYAHVTPDLNAVRLCFQVFLELGGRMRTALAPVVSDVIYDKKAMSDLAICRLSHCSGPVSGGLACILLCEKVMKEDITVNFFERVDGEVTWQANASSISVHKQVAISFTTPPYRDIHVESHVQVYIQLKRLDGATSDPMSFELFPMSSDAPSLKRKRQKHLSDLSQFGNLIPDSEKPNHLPIPQYFQDFMNPQKEQKPIKLEPRDRTPPHPYSQHSQHSPQMSNMGMYRNIGQSPSPLHAGPTPSPPLHQYAPMDTQYMSPSPQQMLPTPSPPLHQYAPTDPQQYMWNMASGNQVMHGQNLAVPGPAPVYQPPLMQDMAGAWPNQHMNISQQQQPIQQNIAIDASDPPSITGLLMHPALAQINAADLSNLSNFLDPDNVSDSFTRLTTGDYNARNQL